MATVLSRHAPTPTTSSEWLDLAKGTLKGELKRQNLTYGDLAQRLVEIGVDETETTIRNKVSRGSFSFVFALQAMRAIGVELIPFKPSMMGTIELTPELLANTAATKGGLTDP